MNSYSCARDGPIALHRFAARASSKKLQLPPQVQSNFRRYRGIRDVWLSNLFFFGVFQIIRKKAKPRSIGLSAKRSYFNCIFIKAMWFYENEIISMQFFLFVIICFQFACISRCLTHGVRGGPVKISLHASVLIFRAETPVLANEVSVILCRITGFTKNDFWQLKLGVIFTLKKKKKKKRQRG